MTEREWFTVIAPGRMLNWLLGRTTERKLGLFAVACCRRVSHLCSTPEFHNAVAAAERFADAVTNEDRNQFKLMRNYVKNIRPSSSEIRLAYFSLHKEARKAAQYTCREAKEMV